MPRKIEVAQARQNIREMFAKWGFDPSEYEIVWQEERLDSGFRRKLAGVTVYYSRDGKQQTVSCISKSDRATNLQQLYLFLDRIRISEKVGIQYQGLSFTKEVTATEQTAEHDRKEDLLEAYDVLGVSPDDPLDLVKSIYARKAQHYHPDKGGDPERFKRLDEAYKSVMASRGERG